MPRGKNYVNGNRGVHLQSSRGGSSNMNMCEYGEACQRSDCIYRHPQDEQNDNNNDDGGRSGGGSGSSGGRSGGSGGGGGNNSNRRPSNNNNKYHGGGSGSGGSSDLCIPFLAGKCTFTKGCRKRHPSKEDLPRLLARYKQIRCRFGDDCYTDGCLFSHPKEISSHKKSLEPAFIEPHDFPPLGVVEANGIGNDGGKQQVNNANSAWNNKNSNSNITATTTTTTNGLPPDSPAAAPVVGTEAFSSSEKGQGENNNENPDSSSPSASRSSPTQDHQTQQQQQSIAPTAWGYVSNGGPPLQQQQQGGGGPMMMNPQQQQLRLPQGPPTPQQAYYGGPPPPAMVAAGPPPPGGVGPGGGGGGGYPTMIDPNTGYQIQIDPVSYYHQMQQQQYQQYPYAAAQFPMGYNNTIQSPQHFFNAEAKEFVPGITFFA